MDPEKTLNLLLSQLPLLDSATIKFIREIFFEILSSCKSLRSSTCLRKESPSKINDFQDTAAKLREVIAFFNSADDDRDEFLVRYPDWEAVRKLNIKKLDKIAESIQESRENCNAAQILGGGVGVIGGLAVIGSILFPPAATVLLPSFLLPAAATATSALAVGGSIAAGAGSIAQVVTSVTEATILSNRIAEAKKICLQDKESFDRMMRWFERTHQLETVLNHLFGENILDIIFRDLKEYFGSSSLHSKMFRIALTNCVGKIAGIRSNVNLSYHAAVTAVTFSVFLVQRRNRCLFQCVILTNKLGLGLTTAFNAKAQFTRLVANTVMKKGKGKLIGRALASKVALGAFAGIGIALDLANIVLNAEDMEKGSKSEVQEKILEVAVELQTNLHFIRNVYKELWSTAKKASEEFFDSLIVDQLGMSGETKTVSHIVYQDVLQETRKLRVYLKRTGRKQGDKQEKEINQRLGQMEPCANSLRQVINFFNEADKERANFLSNFPQWENKRKENISHLHSVAESLHETKKLRHVAKQVGLIGGAVAIGAGLLHLWIPYLLLPMLLLTGVVVTSTLAIIIFNGSDLFVQLPKQIEDLSGICKQDQEEFDKIVGWFRRTHELDCALDEVFGSEVLNFILPDLRIFCGGGVTSYRRSSLHASALKSCVDRIFGHNISRLQLEPSLQGAAIAVVLAVLLDQQRNLSHLNCFNLTHRMGIVKSRSRDCRWTLNLTKQTDEEASVLKMLETVLFNGRDVFWNTIHAILKLTESDDDKIAGMAEELQKELSFMKKVFIQLS